VVGPVKSITVAPRGLGLDDFVPDAPFTGHRAQSSDIAPHDVIDGVTVTPLTVNADSRGLLTEFLTAREGLREPIVHVYQVTALPGSIRAWVYHRRQFDRLAFVNGRFEIVLYDIRPTSPTKNRLNVFVLGHEQPALLRMPPLVIHGVRNAGAEIATFVNLPTRIYDPQNPDKCRLSADDPRIPYRFDGQ